jgi:hypothetical protein
MTYKRSLKEMLQDLRSLAYTRGLKYALIDKRSYDKCIKAEDIIENKILKEIRNAKQSGNRIRNR